VSLGFLVTAVLAFAGDSFQLIEQMSMNNLDGACREAALAFSEVTGLTQEVSSIVVVETDAGSLGLLIHRDSQGRFVVDWASDADGGMTYAFRTTGSTQGFSATEEVESSWFVHVEGRPVSDGVELGLVSTGTGAPQQTLARSVRYGQCWVFS
jgi:hypothetical protein